MSKKSISDLKVIRNDKMKNFLELNGIYPVREWYEEAWYKKTPKFLSLLDDYYIQFHCVPNRLENF